jgi:hypothetical protein
MAKQITREQAERKKARAASFLSRIGQPDRAEEFEGMSTDDYAEHKGYRLANSKRRFQNMPRLANQTAAPSKADLQDTIDSAIEILDDAYEPESTREELAEAVGSALRTLRDEGEEEEVEEDEEDLDDSDDSDDLD